MIEKQYKIDEKEVWAWNDAPELAEKRLLIFSSTKDTVFKYYVQDNNGIIRFVKNISDEKPEIPKLEPHPMEKHIGKFGYFGDSANLEENTCFIYGKLTDIKNGASAPFYCNEGYFEFFSLTPPKQ